MRAKAERIIWKGEFKSRLQACAQFKPAGVTLMDVFQAKTGMLLFISFKIKRRFNFRAQAVCTLTADPALPCNLALLLAILLKPAHKAVPYGCFNKWRWRPSSGGRISCRMWGKKQRIKVKRRQTETQQRKSQWCLFPLKPGTVCSFPLLHFIQLFY